MKRMRLAALFAAVLLLAAAPVRAAQMEYGEPVLSAWATDSYYKANEYSILNWFCRSGDFTAPITRAEFCDMLFNAVQAISYGAAAQIDLGGPGPFTDTDRDSVYCLAQLGIAQGVGGGRFDPEGTLTRQQAAVFLSRAAARLDFSCLPEVFKIIGFIISMTPCPTSTINTRLNTPTCGAARPTPLAFLSVSAMSSSKTHSLSSNEVTSREVFLNIPSSSVTILRIAIFTYLLT